MLNLKKIPLNFKKSQGDIDPEGINFLDLGYGRTRYEEEMGEAPPEGMFFVDIDADAGPDALWNLDGGIPLTDSSIGGTINLGHILVYLHNPVFVAQEVLRIAKPGTNVEIGTYISVKEIVADPRTWNVSSAEIESIKDVDTMKDSVWSEKTHIFIDTLSRGAQLVRKELGGIYEEDAQVFFTFQVV